MIEANKGSAFPITVSLVDDLRGELVSNQVVTYNVRTINDVVLSPTVTGTLLESTVEEGIYKTELSINGSGSYICYVTCSGFITSTENIVINEENIYEITKENRTYNTSVVDVKRTSVSGTVSQLNRKVDVGNTDYVVTVIKHDGDYGWNAPVASGVNFAWYESLETALPYMMSGEY